MADLLPGKDELVVAASVLRILDQDTGSVVITAGRLLEDRDLASAPDTRQTNVHGLFWHLRVEVLLLLFHPLAFDGVYLHLAASHHHFNGVVHGAAPDHPISISSGSGRGQQGGESGDQAERRGQGEGQSSERATNEPFVCINHAGILLGIVAGIGEIRIAIFSRRSIAVYWSGMLRRTELLFFSVFVLAVVLAAGCDSGIQTEGAPVVARNASSEPVTAPTPAVAASASPSPAASGGPKKPSKIVLVQAPIDVSAPPENLGQPYMKTSRGASAVPLPPKNNSAMPDAVVDYVRFVRTLEEDRQRHMLGRQAILEQQGATAPTEEKVAALLKDNVQQARARLAKLRTRTAPQDCRIFAQKYEAALIEDGAEADQDATLVTQALAAGKAGDTAMRDTLLSQLRARGQERQQRRDVAFGRADTAFVRLLQRYPSTPPDFASIRIGDKPF